MLSKIVRTIPLVLLIAAATLTQAQAACDLPEMRTDERPDPAGKPTKVTISIVVVDFLGVDDVNQRIELDMISTLSWRDERLAALEGCRFPVTDVWNPQPRIFNSSDLRLDRQNARNQVAVGEDGIVSHHQRLTGVISSYHNLRQFPFDSHDFTINIGNLRYPAADLEFVADTENTWIGKTLNIEGWKVKGIGLAVAPVKIARVDFDVSVATLTLTAGREYAYYLFRVLMMLVFVVGMSWAIFWIPPGRYEFQIGLGATSMLTVIAFSLSIAGHLPRLGYMTIMDKMLVWSVLLIFLSIVEALVAGRLEMKGKEHSALRLDKVSRFVFPAMLFGGWALMIVAS